MKELLLGNAGCLNPRCYNIGVKVFLQCESNTFSAVCCPALPTYTEKNFYAVEDVYLTDERDLTYASYQYTYSGEKVCLKPFAKDHALIRWFKTRAGVHYYLSPITWFIPTSRNFRPLGSLRNFLIASRFLSAENSSE